MTFPKDLKDFPPPSVMSIGELAEYHATISTCKAGILIFILIAATMIPLAVVMNVLAAILNPGGGKMAMGAFVVFSLSLVAFGLASVFLLEYYVVRNIPRYTLRLSKTSKLRRALLWLYTLSKEC